MNSSISLTSSKNYKKNENIKIKYKKSIFEKFNLDKIGSIKLAKNHRSASRPLHKIDNFNNETEFCQCCNLPVEQEGILEKFEFWQDPNKYVECGEGITLYFTFFKFAIIILFLTSIIVILINIIISLKYYEEIENLCYKYKNSVLIENNCKLLLKELDDKSKQSSLLSHFYFSKLNSMNTKLYRNLYYNLTLDNNKAIDKVIVNTSFTNFICLITLLIFNLMFSILINSKSQFLKYDVLSLSDYSIFITNLKDIHEYFINKKKELKCKKNNIKFNYEELLNKELGIDKHLNNSSELDQFNCFLKNKICRFDNNQILKNIKVNICFKISELMKLEKKLHIISEKISKVKHHPYQNLKNQEKNFDEDNLKYFNSFINILDMHCCEKTEDLKKLQKDEKELLEKIDKLMKESKDNTMQYFAGCAIICLNNIKDQEKFLEKKSEKILVIYIFKLFGYVLCRCCKNKNKRNIEWLKGNIRFERAPEPEDIIFENLEYANTFTKFIIIFLVYFFSLVLIVICFIIVTSLNYLRKYSDEKNNFNIFVTYIISILISLCIFIINLFFEKILDFLTKREKQSTTTNYFLSKSIKLTLFSFMNSAIVPLISELYVETKGYEYLIINMLMVFLINSILVPLSWTINFSYFYKKIRICLIEKKQNPYDTDGYHEKTQRELNELYELPSMNISEKYSYIFKTLLISFFYIPIFPLGVLISLFGLFIGYFLEKYNFCNIYKRPEMLNDQLYKTYINYFITALFICGVGDYIFKNDLYNTSFWSLINIILFGVLIIVPYQYFINYLIKDYLYLNESEYHKSNLDEVYLKFFNDYERANPMTKKEGITNYLKGLNERNIISDSILKTELNNLENVNLMKLYYDERKKSNILKTQKTLLEKDNNYHKYNIITKTLTIKKKDINDILNDIEDYNEDDNDKNNNVVKYKNIIFKSNISNSSQKTSNLKESSSKSKNNFTLNNNYIVLDITQ